MSLICFFMWNS